MGAELNHEAKSEHKQGIAAGDFCAAVKAWEGRSVDDLLATHLINKNNVVLEKNLPTLKIDGNSRQPTVVIDQEHGKVENVICNDKPF